MTHLFYLFYLILIDLYFTFQVEQKEWMLDSMRANDRSEDAEHLLK